jgi:hypothetical protein
MLSNVDIKQIIILRKQKDHYVPAHLRFIIGICSKRKIVNGVAVAAIQTKSPVTKTCPYVY